MRPIESISLDDKFSLFTEQWSPKIIAELNGQQVKLARFAGDFVWHSHADADEMFLVIAGEMRMGIRDESGEREVAVGPGELIVIPDGVEHRPAAASGEVLVMLFEPAGVVNTGDAGGDLTNAAEWI